jgi:hypothetical protein
MNVLPKALIAALVGLGIQFAVYSVLPLAGAISRRVNALNLLDAAVVSLLPTATLLLFFAALFREISMRRSIRLRRSVAVVATLGQTLQFSFAIWNASSFLPYDPAQYWAAFALLQILPTLLWLVLLVIFAKERFPGASMLTRPVAALLSVLTAIGVVRAGYRIVARLAGSTWNTGDLWIVAVRQASYVLGSLSVAFLLLAVYKEYGARGTESSLPAWKPHVP